MSDIARPRHDYQATFRGAHVEGSVRCPRCGSGLIHPTGKSRAMHQEQEYGPVIAVFAQCECGSPLELQLGNYKGDLALDVVQVGP